jgi:biopolymer transport protein ExbD
MAFAPSKRRRLKKIEPAGINLNPMMDIMTILLLFLLKSYTVSGALIHPSINNLPISSAEKEPTKTLSLILTQDGLFEDIGSEFNPETMDGQKIISKSDLSNASVTTFPRLEKYLSDRRAFELSLGKKVPSRELTIQAADNVPYAWILKLISSASNSDYDTFEFLVLREEGGEGE